MTTTEVNATETEYARHYPACNFPTVARPNLCSPPPLSADVEAPHRAQMSRRLPPLVDAAALYREPMSRCPTMKKPFSDLEI
ncbi:hypothetical protein OROGR_010044 [Orobanche gracilis]